MKNEEISMQELLEIINGAFEKFETKVRIIIDESAIKLKQELKQELKEKLKTELLQELDYRFTHLETNMASKPQMYRLIDSLRGRKVISEFDSNYVMNSQL